MNAELRKSLSVYSLKEAGSKTSQKESPLKKFSISKGPVSPIEEYMDDKDNEDGDKPIRRTVSFTNSVEVMGEAKVESEQQPTDAEAKIKRTRSSERFNASQRNRRRSTAMSIR